jgi:hypothetical protein
VGLQTLMMKNPVRPFPILLVAVVPVTMLAACGGPSVERASLEGGLDATGKGGASEPSEASSDGPMDSTPPTETGSRGLAETGGGGQSEGDSDAGESECALSTADSVVGGSLNWAASFAVTEPTTVFAVAVDPSNGDVVTAGFFYGTVNFGGGLETSFNDAAAGDATEGAFVAKFDATGKYVWQKAFGNGAYAFVDAVAIDSSGNVAVAGTFDGSLTFGDVTLDAIGEFDVFVVEFDSTGTYLWSKSFGVAEQMQYLDALTVDAAGEVVIAGRASGGLNLGGASVTGGYIAKFSSTGTYAWSEVVPNSTEGLSLAVDGAGNVVVAGDFSGTENFGGGPLTSIGGVDVFAAKYDPSGAYRWARQYSAISSTAGNNTGAHASGIAVDGCGNILVLGSFEGMSGVVTISLGSGMLTSSDGSRTAFIAKLDPTGGGVWSKEFLGCDAYDRLTGAVAADPAGRVTFACLLSGSVDYGGGTLASANNEDTVSVASFDAAGTYRWSYAAQPPSPESFRVAANGTSVVLAGGSVGTGSLTSPSGTTLTLPGTTLTAMNSQELFVASLTP